MSNRDDSRRRLELSSRSQPRVRATPARFSTTAGHPRRARRLANSPVLAESLAILTKQSRGSSDPATAGIHARASGLPGREPLAEASTLFDAAAVWPVRPHRGAVKRGLRHLPPRRFGVFTAVRYRSTVGTSFAPPRGRACARYSTCESHPPSPASASAAGRFAGDSWRLLRGGHAQTPVNVQKHE